MASSYSTDLKLELMVTGENAGTWGDKTNTNLNLIQQSVAGVQGIDVGAADVTLVMSNAALSNARNMVLVLNGSLTGNRQVLVPNGIEKFYIIHDQTTRNGYSLTIKTVSGTGFAIETTAGSSDMAACFSDGTDVYEISLNTLSGSIAAAQIDSFAVTTAKINSLAVTSTRLASFAVTSGKIASFAVTSGKVASLAITSTRLASFAVTSGKIATGAVTATRLASTAVTAGTYNAATITVDAQGRLTAASSGAGGGSLIFKQQNIGPASGNVTSANASKIFLFITGGQGNMGPAPGYSAGGSGGAGGAGLYIANVTAPYSASWTLAGAAGQSTFGNIATVNGGGTGNSGVQAGPAPGNIGSAGNAPGATFDLSGNNNTGNYLDPDATSAPYTTKKWPPQGVYSTAFNYTIGNAGQGGRPGMLTLWFTE